MLIPGVDEQMPRQRAVQQEIASLAAPVELEPVSDDPITLHMVEDSKVIFQAIGKLAGLNVIFDPEYTSKRIQVDLNSVPLYDALRIVETLSGTFWKPVTTNTIFVAQNTRNKRTDLDDQAVQTFYLTNVSQQNDANEILVAMRNLLDPDGEAVPGKQSECHRGARDAGPAGTGREADQRSRPHTFGGDRGCGRARGEPR